MIHHRFGKKFFLPRMYADVRGSEERDQKPGLILQSLSALFSFYFSPRFSAQIRGQYS